MAADGLLPLKLLSLQFLFVLLFCFLHPLFQVFFYFLFCQCVKLNQVIQRRITKRAQSVNIPLYFLEHRWVPGLLLFDVFNLLFSDFLAVNCLFPFHLLDTKCQLPAPSSFMFISFPLVSHSPGFLRLWLHQISFSCILVLTICSPFFSSFATTSLLFCVERSPSTAQSPSPL